MIDLAEAGRDERNRPTSAPTPIADLARRARQIQRRRRLTIIAPLIAVVAATITVVATRPSQQHVVVTGPPNTTGPAVAPAASNQPHLWLSATTVPTTGADLVAAVVNPTTRGYTYGVGGSAQRWTGTKWQAYGHWTVSLDMWGGFGTITKQDTSVFLIGLGVLLRSIGPAEYFHVPALPAGWYRVGYPHTKHTPATFGIFHVAANAPKPVPVSNPTGPTITAGPTVLPTSASTIITLTAAPATNASPGKALNNFQLTLSPDVHLQQWAADTWTTVRALRPQRRPATTPPSSTVTLPALHPGAYRLVWYSKTVGNLTRNIWVNHLRTLDRN